MRPRRRVSRLLPALVGFAGGLPADRSPQGSLQDSYSCKDTHMVAWCPKYDQIMQFCCDEAGPQKASFEICESYANDQSVCGGPEKTKEAMKKCCLREWSSKSETIDTVAGTGGSTPYYQPGPTWADRPNRTTNASCMSINKPATTDAWCQTRCGAEVDLSVCPPEICKCGAGANDAFPEPAESTAADSPMKMHQGGTAYCHDMQRASTCPKYTEVMSYCCEEAGDRKASPEICDSYANDDGVCGGRDNMEVALAKCCSYEWSQQEPANRSHDAMANELRVDQTTCVSISVPTATDEWCMTRCGPGMDQSICPRDLCKCDLVAESPSQPAPEQVPEQHTADAADGAAANFGAATPQAGPIDAPPSSSSCVSINVAAATDEWCQTRCTAFADPSVCPPTLCKCGSMSAPAP